MEEPDKIRFREESRLPLELGRLAHSRLQQLFAAGHFGYQQIAEMRQQVPAEATQVVASHYYLIDDGNGFGGGVLSDSVHDPRENIGACYAEREFDILFLDRCAGETNHLIKSRLGIAYGALAGASYFS